MTQTGQSAHVIADIKHSSAADRKVLKLNSMYLKKGSHLDRSGTFGVTMTAMRRVVPCRRKLLATTVAPWQ